MKDVNEANFSNNKIILSNTRQKRMSTVVKGNNSRRVLFDKNTFLSEEGLDIKESVKFKINGKILEAL